MKQIPMTADEPVPLRYRIWWTILGWTMSACKRLTNHRWRRLEAYSVGVEPTEYHYQCRICREVFWNYKPPTRKKDIKRLEAWRQEEGLCPSCGVKLKTETVIDCQTEGGYIFDVWITSCPQCQYVHECDIDGLSKVEK